MHQYLDLLRTILEHGTDRSDRTGTGTRGVFGHQMRFDLRAGFPLLTTKKLAWKAIVHELLWFLRGSTDVRELQAVGVHIWDAWATAEQCAKFGRAPGDLGPIYSKQWRRFGETFYNDGVDQIARVVEQIKRTPDSRRLIVSAWNPREVDQVALPPCHTLFQFYVQDGELSCQLYQRSGDVFLGVPFNIASYALLTHMIAQACDLRVGDFVHTLGDAHLYKNHLTQAHEQLQRAPRAPPKIRLDPTIKDVFAFRFEHVSIEDYDPHPHIQAEVSV